MEIINIMIVDDQNLFADSLQTVLNLEDDMEVVATCSNGEEALEKARETRPDLVLMDIRMPEMNGVECTRMLKADYPDVKIVMLTTFDYDEYVVDALLAGANGYILKDTGGDRLIASIREVHRGNFVMPETIARKVGSRLQGEEGETESSIAEILSSRELEIGKLMVRGFSNREIAKSLNITEGTVKNYISELYSKIGINDRTRAVIYLKRRGL